MGKTKRKLNLSAEERERRRARGKELAKLRKEKQVDKKITQPYDQEVKSVAPIEGKEIKPSDGIQFYSNLANTQIGSIKFSNHLYETSNPKEIEFLRSYGARQGCVITEVKEESKKGEK